MRKKGNFTPRKRSTEDSSKSTGDSSKSVSKTRVPRTYKAKKATPPPKKDDGLIRLNRFIANAGVCSRREADNLILAGVIKVNGEPITQMGYKVKSTDRIHYGDRLLKREEIVYILLNKPKDYVSTSKDPQNRKTVMHLLEGATKERVYSVGRLDKNTTGLLLFTNDGFTAKKLTHPSHNCKKIYQVTADKNVKQEHLKMLEQGIKLEDGIAKADVVSYVEGKDKKVVGIEIHIGKNRIVRRMFEHLGYQVIKLDRTYFAGLTKKNLPRSKWRILKEEEINMLKMI